VDLEVAHASGTAAVQFALEGKSNVMVSVQRQHDCALEFTWKPVATDLSVVWSAGAAYLPKQFISADGWGITEDFKE